MQTSSLLRMGMAAKGFLFRYLMEDDGSVGLGTAGCMLRFKGEISRDDPGFFFLMHVDIACTFPLMQLLHIHLITSVDPEGSDSSFPHPRKNICTILGCKVPSAPSQSDEYGFVVKDQNTTKVLHYVNRPESQISQLISCGMYIFSPEILSIIEKEASKKYSNPSLLPGGHRRYSVNESYVTLEEDILPKLCDTNLFHVCETNDFWCQIKTCR